MASFGTLLRAGGSLDLRRTRGILSAEGQFFFGEGSVAAWHDCCSCSCSCSCSCVLSGVTMITLNV